ncbi:MAG: succinylglutamate desuccinylase/aspartoacylase family protein [Thermogutta sp.]
MSASTLLAAASFLLPFGVGMDFFLAEDAPLAHQPEMAVIDSGVKGPTVLIVAGVHGNETASIEAARRIAGWKIVRGQLVVISEANRPAIAAQKRLIPGVDAQQADLNRNFPVDQNGCRPVGDIATQLWNIVTSQSPDWVIDLHESINFRRVNPENVGNTIIVCPNKQTLPLAKKLIEIVNHTISEESKKFLILEWPAKGSLTRAAAQELRANAMIIETTRRESFDIRVEQHCLLVRSLLRELGMLESPEK